MKPRFPQFIISFDFRGKHYTAEVKVFDFENRMLFDVYYTETTPILKMNYVQLYAGLGASPRLYWRQRMTGKDDELLECEFIARIGDCIEVQKY